MKIREQDGITDEDIKYSLHPELNRDMVFKAGESQGKSGSFFFFCHDKQFIIKTMTDSELTTFLRIFQDLYGHQEKYNNSLLARIYGIFTIKMEDIVPVNLILMGNTAKILDSKQILHVFDLKGSSVNREVKITSKTRNTSTLKDINFVKLCQEEVFVRFQREDRKRLLEVIEQDVEFLQSHGLMDYSLLLAVEKNKQSEILRSRRNTKQNQQNAQTQADKDEMSQLISEIEEREENSVSTLINEDHTNLLRESIRDQLIRDFKKTRHSFISLNGKFIYHIAIIDYLQEFNLEKRLESKIKTCLLMREYSLISAIDPKPYANRFFHFMKEKVLIDAKENPQDRENQSFLKRIRSKSIQNKEQWKNTLNRDIPLFLQRGSDIEIKRIVQDFKVTTLRTQEEWKMNLLVVSEKHGLLITGVDHELFVYTLDPVTSTIQDLKNYKIISLQNDNGSINNMQLIECDGKEFVATVDFEGHVRMLYLDDLLKDPIKFHNHYQQCNDNSTWSLSGSSVNPPRVVVGSNAHKITVFDLSTGEKQCVNAHKHNVPCVRFSPCGRFIMSTSIDKSVKIWEETNDPRQKYKLARIAFPSQDWGWAAQWLDKSKCDIRLEDKELQQQQQQKPAGSAQESVQKQANDAISFLLGGARRGDTVGQTINMIRQLQSARNTIFSQIRTGNLHYEDDLLEDTPDVMTQQQHGEDSDLDDSTDQNQSSIPLENGQSSLYVEDKPVEEGTESSSEQHLNKYILLHCAKLELSLIDASSGAYLANKSMTYEPNQADLMKIILRQNVQNQMFFEELSIHDIFRMRQYSRYLFLEFIDAFSLILVGNQGSYDLHFFRLINKVDLKGNSRFSLEREYVFKANDQNVRILGVSVIQYSDKAKVYILTSDKKLNCLEVRRRVRAQSQQRIVDLYL